MEVLCKWSMLQIRKSCKIHEEAHKYNFSLHLWKYYFSFASFIGKLIRPQNFNENIYKLFYSKSREYQAKESLYQFQKFKILRHQILAIKIMKVNFITYVIWFDNRTTDETDVYGYRVLHTGLTDKCESIRYETFHFFISLLFSAFKHIMASVVTLYSTWKIFVILLWIKIMTWRSKWQE